MSRNVTRGLQTSARSLIQYVGSSLDELLVSNGPEGPDWSASTDKICNAIEKADPLVTAADIQGSRAHLSSKDRDDPESVITVGLKTHAGTRIGSLHVHLDGSFKFFPSRAGREGGYDQNIARAGINGFIPAENDLGDAGDKSSSSK